MCYIECCFYDNIAQHTNNLITMCACSPPIPVSSLTDVSGRAPIAAWVSAAFFNMIVLCTAQTHAVVYTVKHLLPSSKQTSLQELPCCYIITLASCMCAL